MVDQYGYKWTFVADDTRFPGHNCKGTLPNNNGFNIYGFGETDGLLVLPLNSVKTAKKFNQLS